MNEATAAVFYHTLLEEYPLEIAKLALQIEESPRTPSFQIALIVDLLHIFDKQRAIF